MLRISSETGGKLACRRDRLLHSHGCEARSAEQPADDHPQLVRSPVAAAGFHQLVHDLINAEAGWLLARREFFEALEPLAHESLGGHTLQSLTRREKAFISCT